MVPDRESWWHKAVEPCERFRTIHQYHAPASHSQGQARRRPVGRPPCPVALLQPVDILHQWFALVDRAVEEALHGIPVYLAFAGIDPVATGILEAPTMPHLESHDLSVVILQEVNAVLRARAPMVRRGTLVD